MFSFTSSKYLPITTDFWKFTLLLIAIIIIKIISFHDLRLVIATPVGKIFIVFCQLSSQCFYSRRFRCYNYLLLLKMPTSRKIKNRNSYYFYLILNRAKQYKQYSKIKSHSYTTTIIFFTWPTKILIFLSHLKTAADIC